MLAYLRALIMLARIRSIVLGSLVSVHSRCCVLLTDSCGAVTYRKFFMVMLIMEPSTKRPSPPGPSAWLPASTFAMLLLEAWELLVAWLTRRFLPGVAILDGNSSLPQETAGTFSHPRALRRVLTESWLDKKGHVYTQRLSSSSAAFIIARFQIKRLSMTCSKQQMISLRYGHLYNIKQ